jgi:hypothetical protein
MSRMADPLAHAFDQEEIMAYLDGELSTERARAAQDHLAECGVCAQLAEQWSDISKHCKTWEVEPCTFDAPHAPEIRKGGIRARIVNKFGFVTRHPWAWAIGAAAVAILVISIPRTLPVAQFASRELVAQRTNGLSQSFATQLDGARDASPSPEPAPPPAQAAAPIRTMIANSVQLNLVTRDFDHARTALEAVAQRYGGYVGELNLSAQAGEARSLAATLRVPAPKLENALTEIRALGRVESESRTGEDVTRQYVDLEARLNNSRFAEQRLTELMKERTGKLVDVLAVEMEIARVREQIEQMEAERKTLAGRVDFAAITVKVSEDYKAQVPSWPGSIGSRLRNAAVDGYRGMVEGVVAVAFFLLSWGPGLLLWSLILFWPARYAWRKYRRARSA